MAEQFYIIPTKVGKSKIAYAQATGTTVNLTHIAVGDSGGAYYNPVDIQTELRNEVWRGPINSVNVDEQNPYWIIVEAVIPPADGGFMVREVGIFDDTGAMIAIGKYPETYKPVTTEGSAKDLYIRAIVEVSSASAVTLKIDPAVILATKDDVNKVQQSLDEHKTSSLPHRLTDETSGKKYQYGFKQQNNRLVFMYQEVV